MAYQNQSNLHISEAYILARQAFNLPMQDVYNAPACDSLGPIYFLDIWPQPVTNCSWPLWATSIESAVPHAPYFCPICSSPPSQTHGAWFCSESNLVLAKEQDSPTALKKKIKRKDKQNQKKSSHRYSGTFWKENFKSRAELSLGKFDCCS